MHWHIYTLAYFHPVEICYNLVSWYFELSQPQKITSRLKTMFNLSPIYPARKSSNHKLSINHKSSPDTNSHKTYTNTEHKIFEELVPAVSPLLKKHTRLGHTGIVDHSIDLSIPNFKESIRKEWEEAIKNLKISYKCITVYISAIWQHAAHTTDQLTSPSC